MLRDCYKTAGPNLSTYLFPYSHLISTAQTCVVILLGGKPSGFSVSSIKHQQYGFQSSEYWIPCLNMVNAKYEMLTCSSLLSRIKPYGLSTFWDSFFSGDFSQRTWHANFERENLPSIPSGGGPHLSKVLSTKRVFRKHGFRVLFLFPCRWT